MTDPGEKSEKSAKENQTGLVMGIALGIPFGVVAGLLFFDNLGLGMGLGLSLGIAIGLAFDAQNKKKTDASPDAPREPDGPSAAPNP